MFRFRLRRTAGNSTPTTAADRTVTILPARLLPDTFPWQYTTWDTATWKQLRHVNFNRPFTGVYTFSPVGPQFAMVDGAVIRAENLATGQVVEIAHGHQRVDSLDFNVGGRHLLSASRGESLKVWDASTGRPVHTIPVAALPTKPDHTHRSVLSPDARLLVLREALGRDDGGRICAWDIESRRVLVNFRTKVNVYHAGQPRRAAPGRGGRHGRPCVDPARGRGVMVLRGHAKPSRDLVFSGDERLASISLDETVRVWKLEDDAPGPGG